MQLYQYEYMSYCMRCHICAISVGTMDFIYLLVTCSLLSVETSNVNWINPQIYLGSGFPHIGVVYSLHSSGFFSQLLQCLSGRKIPIFVGQFSLVPFFLTIYYIYII